MKLSACALACLVLWSTHTYAQQPAPTPLTGATVSGLSPAQTVREFYRALREKRFRDAFMLSTYRPAVETLTPAEISDLAPDFAATAANIPDKVDLSDEIIIGSDATLMVNLAEPGEAYVPKEMKLKRVEGVWIITDEEAPQVAKDGKNYFFRLRIETHHSEAEEMMGRIYRAQVVYRMDKGRYGTLQDLLAAEIIPSDITDTISTGYKFRLVVTPDGRSYAAFAEPARYGNTGKLSYYIDADGRLQSGDSGGKPLK